MAESGGLNKMKAARLLICISILCASCLASQKNWQDATVISMSTSEGPLVTAPINGLWISGRVQWIHYIVETADLRADLAVRKNLNITLLKPTKVAFQGQNAFLLDDDGKEKKLAVVQKVAKPTASSEQSGPAQQSKAPADSKH
jgi:hypothetical protein